MSRVMIHPAAIMVGDNPGVVNYGQNEATFEKTGLLEKDSACQV
ncbi:MAG: hypothetical protein ABSE95_17870 [Thermodesulfobacteriota bacterium]|jgi:hypothetical protein